MWSISIRGIDASEVENAMQVQRYFGKLIGGEGPGVLLRRQGVRVT